MSINTILADYRIDNWIDIIQLPDTVWLRYYNDCRDEIIDSIIAEKEDFFYSYYSTNTVIWQNEYRLTKRGDSNGLWWYLDWIHKIKSISWKINSTDGFLTKIKPISFDSLDYDVENFDKTVEPFFYIADNSIFLYPTPLEATELKIYWIMYPKKIIWSDNETLPDNISKAIWYWIKKRYLESIWDVNNSIVASQKFEEEKLKVRNIVSWRIITPIQRTTPYLNNLS